MKHLFFGASVLAASVAASSYSVAFSPDEEYSSVADFPLKEFLSQGTPTGDFNLRFEGVDDEKKDAKSERLSLRSRIGWITPTYKGFSAQVEFEDVRDILGIDDRNGLVADPEVTEVDQLFIQYKTENATFKLGRQNIVHDGARFIGNVVWRQDRQTYDGFRTIYTPTKDLKIDFSYVYKRNRIFAETADVSTDDIFLNVAYQTPIGQITGYYYGLDNNIQDNDNPKSDTFGGFLNGATKGDVAFLYRLEAATQSYDMPEAINGKTEFDALYYNIEAGLKVKGVVVKAAQEKLGSDNGDVSFTTPLATLHKFNGWSDITLAGQFSPIVMKKGLIDSSVLVTTTIKGYKVLARYHDFKADEGSEEYGTEVEAQITRGFKSGYNVGLKYASFTADRESTTFPFDRDIIWTWVGFKF